jgi:short-subunit dehydrogenase
MRIPKVLLPVAGATALAAGWRQRQHPDDIRGEVAVVTGASRGLGLLLAIELARRGCKLVICGRETGELEKAAAQLREGGADVMAVTCDVTGEDAARQLVDTARQRYGRLDIVISSAGVIRVGPVQSTTAADYDKALATMALAPARLALAALPVMQEQGHGRIVTIASIGGKISVPHLLPYSTAKFAAVGFSEGLRAELGSGPVTVTTVVPGLMRTGSHVQARFAGQREREFTWFALGASLPLVSMDAERAARQIVDGMAARRPEVLLTPAGQVAGRLAGLAPGLTAAVLHAAGRVALPAPDSSGEASAGQQLRPAMPAALFKVLTWWGRTASARFNELSRNRQGERA